MEEDLHIAVSTPSSPTSAAPPQSYGGGFFYSAPTSPTHHALSPSSSNSAPLEGAGGSFEFEFEFTVVRHEDTGPEAASGSMTSADELFLNGKIRPMKLSSHLQCPQDLAPLIDVLEEDGGECDDDDIDRFGRGRDLRSRDRSKSLRRRTRSMSPLRTNTAFQWLEEFKDARESTEINEIKEKLEAEDDRSKADDDDDDNGTPSSGASSRSSSAGRNSKRWVLLKELLYRSKSEGRNSSSSSSNRNHKLWSTLSFSPSSSSSSSVRKDKKSSDSSPISKMADGSGNGSGRTKKAVNGLGMNRKRRVGRSAHEVHYTTKRAQAEEMRKKTYLPYRQGLLGCLGFSSKSYGAMNAFLNSVSSR